MEWLALLVPLVIAVGGWLYREIHFRRENQEKATADASILLKEKKTFLEEQLANSKDCSAKEALELQLDETNTALLGLYSNRLRSTLKSAGLPPEEALVTDGIIQLLPEQVIELKEDIDEVKSLPQSESIWDLLSLANAHYYAEEYEDAIDTYDKIISLDDNFYAAIYNRGNTYLELNRYDEALNDFNRALEINYEFTYALINRGITYRKMGKFNVALADFNHALEIKTDEPYALYNLACLFSLQDNCDDALTYLEKAIRGDNKYLEMAKTDKDFDNIRNDPRFKKIVGEE